MCGWVIILVGVAIILPPIDSRSAPPAAVGATVAVLAVVWLILTLIAVGIYFYRAWKKAFRAPNKLSYVAWLAVETAFALLLLYGLIWALSRPVK